MVIDMEILINDLLINYKISGVGQPLVFLHGWGCDLDEFSKVSKQIEDDFTVYLIDLPGFGKSTILQSLSVSEYADIINEFCLKLAINDPIVVGHSFGGRIAINFASRYQVNRLVLVATPGVKQHFNL